MHQARVIVLVSALLLAGLGLTMIQPVSAGVGDVNIDVGETVQRIDLASPTRQTGSFIINGTLEVTNATLRIVQERDYQYEIHIQGGTLILGPGGVIESTHAFRIIMDGGEIRADGARIMASRLSIDGGILHLIETELNATGTQVVADKVTLEGFTYRDSLPGTWEADIFEIIDSDLGDVTLHRVGRLDIRGSEIDSLDVRTAEDSISISDSEIKNLRVQTDGDLTIRSSEIRNVTRLDYDGTFLSEDATWRVGLSFDEDATFRNTTMPDLTARGSAILTVEGWNSPTTGGDYPDTPGLTATGGARIELSRWLTVVATDRDGDPIADANVTISVWGSRIASGHTDENGEAPFLLLVDTITSSTEDFTDTVEVLVEIDDGKDSLTKNHQVASDGQLVFAFDTGGKGGGGLGLGFLGWFIIIAILLVGLSIGAAWMYYKFYYY